MLKIGFALLCIVLSANSFLMIRTNRKASPVYQFVRDNDTFSVAKVMNIMHRISPEDFKVATKCLLSLPLTANRSIESSEVESVLQRAGTNTDLMLKLTSNYDLQLAAYVSGAIVMASKYDPHEFFSSLECIEPKIRELLLHAKNLEQLQTLPPSNYSSLPAQQNRDSLINHYIQYASSFLTRYEQQRAAETLSPSDRCLSRIRQSVGRGGGASIADGMRLNVDLSGATYRSSASFGSKCGNQSEAVEWSSVWCEGCWHSSESELGLLSSAQTNVLKYSLIGLSHILVEVAKSVEEHTEAQQISPSTVPTRRKLRIHKSNWNKQSALILAIVVRCGRLLHACEHGLESEHQHIARDTLQHWVPLVHELDLADKLPELAECSYHILYSQVYRSTVEWYRVFSPIADKLILSLVASFNAALRADPYLCTVFEGLSLDCRIKHPLSIFEKMLRPGSTHMDLHDIVGLRLIAEPGCNLLSNDDAHSIASGFESCGGNRYVNNQLQHLRRLLVNCTSDWFEDKGAFKNYVLFPKDNGYQSLHMVMIHRPTGLRIEIQLRTSEMHRRAEWGSASHDYYKSWMCRHAGNRTSVDLKRTRWNSFQELRGTRKRRLRRALSQGGSGAANDDGYRKKLVKYDQ